MCLIAVTQYGHTSVHTVVLLKSWITMPCCVCLVLCALSVCPLLLQKLHQTFSVQSSLLWPFSPHRQHTISTGPVFFLGAAWALSTLSPASSATGSESSEASKFLNFALNSPSVMSAEPCVTISVNGLYFSGNPLMTIAIISPSLGASPAPLSAVMICSARITYLVTVSLSAFFSAVIVMYRKTIRGISDVVFFEHFEALSALVLRVSEYQSQARIVK